MVYKGLSGGIYRPLSGEDVETIHAASLDILEKTGFTYEAGLDSTLDMLDKAGATVNRKTERVRFPRDLIMEQIVKAPARVVLCSRDNQYDLDLTEDRVHLGTGGAAISSESTPRMRRAGNRPDRTTGGTGARSIRRQHLLCLPEINYQACHVRCERCERTASGDRPGRNCCR